MSDQRPVCPCGADRPCMSPMTSCDHPMRADYQERLMNRPYRWHASAETRDAWRRAEEEGR